MAAGEVKRILLACGTGVCTSTVATNKLSTALDARGFKGQYSVTQCLLSETVAKSPSFDVLVCTAAAPGGVTIPVINGLCFLTGVGMDKAVDEVVSVLGL